MEFDPYHSGAEFGVRVSLLGGSFFSCVYVCVLIRDVLIIACYCVCKAEAQSHLLCSLAFVIADFITALLIRSIGQLLQVADIQNLKSLGAGRLTKISENFPAGDIASLVYLWNPLTIITCLGYTTSPIENLMIAF